MCHLILGNCEGTIKLWCEPKRYLLGKLWLGRKGLGFQVNPGTVGLRLETKANQTMNPIQEVRSCSMTAKKHNISIHAMKVKM